MQPRTWPGGGRVLSASADVARGGRVLSAAADVAGGEIVGYLVQPRTWSGERGT